MAPKTPVDLIGKPQKPYTAQVQALVQPAAYQRLNAQFDNTLQPTTRGGGGANKKGRKANNKKGSKRGGAGDSCGCLVTWQPPQIFSRPDSQIPQWPGSVAASSCSEPSCSPHQAISSRVSYPITQPAASSYLSGGGRATTSRNKNKRSSPSPHRRSPRTRMTAALRASSPTKKATMQVRRQPLRSCKPAAAK